MNAICIAAGAIGALVPSCKLPMFVLGMVTFVMFNAKLFGAMMSKAKQFGDAVASKYTTVTALTMAIWCAYPAMYLACEVYRMLPIEMEVMLYVVLDVAAKCGCSFLLIGSHDVLAAVSKKESLLGA